MVTRSPCAPDEQRNQEGEAGGPGHCRESSRRGQNAQQAHPSAPQNELRSEAATVSWGCECAWPWTPHGLALFRATARRPAASESAQAPKPPYWRTGDQSGIAGGGAAVS